MSDDEDVSRADFWLGMLKRKQTSVTELKDEIAESKKAITSLSKRKMPTTSAPDRAYQRYCRAIEHEWNELRAREEAIARFTKKPDPATPRPTRCPPPMRLKFWGKDPSAKTDADDDYDWSWGKGIKPAGYDERKRERDEFEANAAAEYAEYKSRGLWGAPMKCVKIKNPLSSFDRRSIRTLKRGTATILVGCPRGEWQPRKQRCRVGTRAYEVITPGRCKRGAGGKTKRS